MKIVKILLISLTVLSVFASAEQLQQDENEFKCRTCQRVVYQLKFDKMADCGDKPCKNTCHKVVQQWNAPNSIFADFQNDVLGKCDICFRAGFCSLTECDQMKAHELRIVNEIVENGIYRGIVDKLDGSTYLITNNKYKLSQQTVTELEKNVKKSLKNSIRAGNAEVAAKQVGNVVNNYVSEAANKQNDKVVKRSVVYQNFIVQANIVKDATEKEITELRALLEDYAKMKDFKTVSPVTSRNNNEKERNGLKKTMKTIIRKVKASLDSNLELVNSTVKNLNQTLKKSLNYKQAILKRNQRTISAAEKKHLDSLETEINALTQFKTPLEEIRQNFLNKLQNLKSFSFRINNKN